MKKTLRHPLTGFALAVLLTVAAVGLRWLMNPWLGERLTLVTLFPAIAAATWLGGIRLALIPGVLGYAACFFLFRSPDDYTFGATDAVALAAYLVAATSVVSFGVAMLQAQQQEREQRELLRVTLASIGNAVITTDIEGKVTSMNPTGVAMTGWREIDAVGRPIETVFQIVNETTRKNVPNPVFKALRKNVVVGLANHTILLSKDGREISIDDSAAPIRDFAGRLVGGVLTCRDIGERRRAEKVLRESEGRHRFLAALAMSIQDLTEPEEIMATTARLLAEYLGVDRCAYAEVEDESIFVITGDYSVSVPSIVGRWPVAAFGPEVERLMLANEAYVMDDVDSDPRAGTNLEAYRQTTIQAVICVPLHKAGKFTAAMAVHQTTPRHWQPDEVELVSTVVARCWESLERSRTNRELKNTAERLMLALDAARFGDWSWDVANDLVTFSPRAAEIYGIPPGPTMTWTDMQELIPEQDREPTQREVARALAAHDQYDMEYRVRRRSGGNEVWVSVRGRAQYDAGGNPLGMFGVLQDITDRKKLEHDLRKNAEELADADRKKDDFIALLAHELRNPLAPIRTGLDVIRLGGADSEKVRLAREMMERQLNHMVRLVDDLLDVSRITRNKLLLQTKPISLSQVIEHAIESSRPVLEDAGHRLEVSIPPEPAMIQGDLTRLTQVFGNLIANSAKFTDPGGKIEVSAKLQGNRVVVAVKDSGMGIPREELSHVFDMFVQVDRSRGWSKGGLGIGLALVKALVEMHGGTVTAKSEGVGKGSTFLVNLPLMKPVAGRPGQTPRDPAHGKEGRPSQLAGLKVLVADDNLDGATALSQLLEILGSEVYTAADGEEAVATAERVRPDLILMDVGMPGMSGLDATRRIRARPWGNGLMIIALTGWGREEDRDKSTAAGCDGHLVKPVSLVELDGMLGGIRGRRK